MLGIQLISRNILTEALKPAPRATPVHGPDPAGHLVGWGRTAALGGAGFMHPICHAGAGGANIRVAREDIACFSHWLAATSANTGLHTPLKARHSPTPGCSGQIPGVRFGSRCGCLPVLHIGQKGWLGGPESPGPESGVTKPHAHHTSAIGEAARP